MMHGDAKSRKVLRNEKVLKKLHGNYRLDCTNTECSNSVKVTKDERERVFLCTRCNKGYLRLRP